MVEFMIINVFVSLVAMGLAIVYMEKFVEKKWAWWEDHGHTLMGMSIFPGCNVFVLVLVGLRIWQAAKGNINSHYN